MARRWYSCMGRGVIVSKSLGHDFTSFRARPSTGTIMDHAVVARLRRAEDGQLKVAAAQTAHEAERELVRLDLTHELAPEARRNPTLLEDTGGGGLELRPPGRRDIDGHGLRVEEEAKQHGLALHREIALRFLHAPVEVAEQLQDLGDAPAATLLADGAPKSST